MAKKETDKTQKVLEEKKRYQWRSGTRPETISDAAQMYLSGKQSSWSSEHTVRSYRNAINSIGAIIARLHDQPANALPLNLINKHTLVDAFNEYSMDRSPASKRQAWAVWNGMCKLLIAEDCLDYNPMDTVPSAGKAGRNKLPRALPDLALKRLIDYLAAPPPPGKKKDGRQWWELDRAVIMLLLTTGARASEVTGLNLNDISPISDGSGARSIIFHGKGDKERTLTIEREVVQIIEDYLLTRVERLPATTHRESDLWRKWDPKDPLFVLSDGSRMTTGALYYRVKKAYQGAGIKNERSPGALVHQLRHTVATKLAEDPQVTTFQIKSILGHSSLTSTERYTAGAGKVTREAAQRNPVYRMVQDSQA